MYRIVEEKYNWEKFLLAQDRLLISRYLSKENEAIKENFLNGGTRTDLNWFFLGYLQMTKVISIYTGVGWF